MESVNQLISRSQARSETKPDERSRSWTEQTERLTILVFTRMGDLYGPKCKAHGLTIFDDNGQHSEQFRLWCRKLDGLTSKQITAGMGKLEYTCSRNAQAGDESWPPSYAEFVGHCTSNWETAAHKPFERLALPDKGKQERARKAGAEELARMKSLFK
jgi:hypothetical protein